jgi:hypothetical protein
MLTLGTPEAEHFTAALIAARTRSARILQSDERVQ